MRPSRLIVPPEILRLVNEAAQIDLRRIGVERRFWSFQHLERFVLAAKQAREQCIEILVTVLSKKMRSKRRWEAAVRPGSAR